MRKLALTLLIALTTVSVASFSGSDGYGRIGLQAAYPLSLDYDPSPLDWSEWEEVACVSIDGGIGLNDFLELTITINMNLTSHNASDGTSDLSAGLSFAAFGANLYFIEGNIRPYAHLDLGLNIAFYCINANELDYTCSVPTFGLGGGVGGQFILGDIFYLDPFVQFRWHAPPYCGFIPEQSYHFFPTMTLTMGLGFGILL